jgi:hypothetical protein
MNKKVTALGEYLLQDNSDADLNAKKKAYWRAYKRNWKKQKRQQEKGFEVFLTLEEYRSLLPKAKQCSMSITRYLKTAALQANGVLTAALVGRIREVFVQQYHTAQTSLEEHSDDTDLVLEALAVAEQRVIALLISR